MAGAEEDEDQIQKVGAGSEPEPLFRTEDHITLKVRHFNSKIHGEYITKMISWWYTEVPSFKR